MNRATIRIVRNDDAALRLAVDGFVSAWNAGQAESHVITFSSPAQLFTVLSPKRWDLLEALQKSGETSIRGLARCLGRDVKRVHDDVGLLLDWGLIIRTASGKVEVPFDVIHTDFDLSAAA